MKFVKFLKLINKQVEKYDNFAQTNPFTLPRNITVVWVEDKLDTSGKLNEQ